MAQRSTIDVDGMRGEDVGLVPTLGPRRRRIRVNADEQIRGELVRDCDALAQR